MYFLVEGINKGMLITGMAFVSKFGTTGAYGIQLIYSQEIFPTNVRSTCLGITAGSGFIGSILAPYSVFLVRNSISVELFKVRTSMINWFEPED